jgi:hypothetical protein
MFPKQPGICTLSARPRRVWRPGAGHGAACATSSCSSLTTRHAIGQRRGRPPSRRRRPVTFLKYAKVHRVSTFWHSLAAGGGFAGHLPKTPRCVGRRAAMGAFAHPWRTRCEYSRWSPSYGRMVGSTAMGGPLSGPSVTSCWPSMHLERQSAGVEHPQRRVLRPLITWRQGVGRTCVRQ